MPGRFIAAIHNGFGPHGRDPPANEIRVGEWLEPFVQRGRNAAAASVAENQDRLYSQCGDRVLDRGGGGMLPAIRGVGRNEVRHVADDE